MDKLVTDSEQAAEQILQALETAIRLWHLKNKSRDATAQFEARRAGYQADKAATRTPNLQAWFEEASVVVGLEGDRSLRRLPPALLASDNKMKFEPNAQELYRLQRRVLGFLSIERLVEERDFGVYRQQLTKASDDLYRQLESYKRRAESVVAAVVELRHALTVLAGEDPWNEIKLCPALQSDELGVATLRAIKSKSWKTLQLSREIESICEYMWPLDIVHEWLNSLGGSILPSLSSAEAKSRQWVAICKEEVADCMRKRGDRVRNNTVAMRNLGKLCGEISIVQESVLIQEDLLGNDELKASVIDELRRCNRDIVGKWATWQRRVQNGLIASCVCAVTLAAILVVQNRTVFSIVPVQDWLLANWWDLVAAAIATYIVVRIRLRIRVGLIKRAFGPFDPDRGRDPRSQKTVNSKSADGFRSYFDWRRGALRQYTHRFFQLAALMVPAAAIGYANWKANSAVERDVGVVRQSPQGVSCVSLSGVPIFKFPTYQVLRTSKSPETLILHRFVDQEELTQAPLSFPKCPQTGGVPIDGGATTSAAIASLAKVVADAAVLQAKTITDAGFAMSKASSDLTNLEIRNSSEWRAMMAKALSDFSNRLFETGVRRDFSLSLSDNSLGSFAKEITGSLSGAARSLRSDNRLDTEMLVRALSEGRSSLADGFQGIYSGIVSLQTTMKEMNYELGVQNCVLAESRLALAGVTVIPGQRDKMYERFSDSCKLHLEHTRTSK